MGLRARVAPGLRDHLLGGGVSREGLGLSEASGRGSAGPGESLRPAQVARMTESVEKQLDDGEVVGDMTGVGRERLWLPKAGVGGSQLGDP